MTSCSKCYGRHTGNCESITGEADPVLFWGTWDQCQRFSWRSDTGLRPIGRGEEREEFPGQREQPVQRPQDYRQFTVFEELVGQCFWGDRAERAMGQGGAGKAGRSQVCAHRAWATKVRVLFTCLICYLCSSQKEKADVLSILVQSKSGGNKCSPK